MSSVVAGLVAVLGDALLVVLQQVDPVDGSSFELAVALVPGVALAVKVFLSPFRGWLLVRFLFFPPR